LFWCSFPQPQFTNILPTDAAPLLENPLQLIQIFGFQEIFLGSLLKYRKALGARSQELLKNQLLA